MSPRRPRLAVPAYFHPGRDAGTRHLLARRDVDLVVVNPCSGAGVGTDPAYVAVCAGPWRSAVVGYIDTAYARRALDDVVDEAATYARRYGVRSVFLDQVTSGPTDLPHYQELTRRLRSAGVGRVALNPGTVPHTGYLEIADVVVTFEDTAERYQQWRPAPTTGSAATWHLVHAAPVDTRRRTLARAARLDATYAYVTDRRLPNPWEALPGEWADSSGGTAREPRSRTDPGQLLPAGRGELRPGRRGQGGERHDGRERPDGTLAIPAAGTGRHGRGRRYFRRRRLRRRRGDGRRPAPPRPHGHLLRQRRRGGELAARRRAVPGRGRRHRARRLARRALAGRPPDRRAPADPR